MRDEPGEISCDAVRRFLNVHWDFRVVEVAYAPVGFGSYHWVASDGGGARWFVTAGRVGATDIGAAAQAAKELADGGYEFVVAPLPDRAGRLVREVVPGWVLVVLPYLDGWSTPGGEWDDPTERSEIAAILGRLHTAVPPNALQRWDFAVPRLNALHAALADLDRPWSAGPYAEPTRLRLAGAREHLYDELARYDALARGLEASDDPWVVTHGEPHSANVVRTPDGRMHLVDWDTVKLAPRERDLAAILDGPTNPLPAYQAEAGPVTPRPAALQLFNLWWSLAEIAEYVHLFRNPHTTTEDTQESWQVLTQYVPG